MRVARQLFTLVVVLGVVLSGVLVAPPMPALAIGNDITSNDNDTDQYSSLTKSPTTGFHTAVWWTDEGSKDFRIRAATSRDGGASWEPEVTIFIGAKNLDTYGVRSAYDSQGGLHALFGFGASPNRFIRHYYVPAGGNPSNPAAWVYGGNVCADGECFNPDIAVDRNDYVYVLYEDEDKFVGIRRRLGTGGTWSNEKRVSASDRQLGAIAVSHNGKLHVLHTEKGGQILRYVRFASFDTVLPEAVEVLDNDVNDQPDMAVGPNGNVHLVWEDSSSIRHREYVATSNSLTERSTIGSQDGRPNVSVVVGGSGTVYVTWNAENFREVWEARRVNGNWQDQERLAGPDPSSRYQRYGEALDFDASLALVQNGILRFLRREEGATDKLGPNITSVTISPPPAGSQRATATISGVDVANSGSPVGIKRFAYSLVGSTGPFVNIDFAPILQLSGVQFPIDLANPAAGGTWTDTTHNVVIYLVDANDNASLPYHHPQFSATLPAVTESRYLAEGYTGSTFDTYLTLANPNAFAIAVSVVFQYAGTSSGPAGTLEVISPNQRKTIFVDAVAGAEKELSFKLQSHGPFVVERPMYFFAYGSGAARAAYGRPGAALVAGVNGGHLGVAADAPAQAWHFAEGYTGTGFDTYYTIQNPNAAVSNVRITYYLAGGGVEQRTLTVNAQARKTVAVHINADGGLGPNQAFASKVETTNGQNLIVERVMYFRYQSGNVGSVTGGTATLGATATNTTWYFAEGYTGGGFDEFLTISNPNPTAGIATIRYFVEGQVTPTDTQVNLPANSRTTVTVNSPTGGGLGPGRAHSTRVQTTLQTVVERPMYFVYNGASISGIDGGHNVMGSPNLIPPGASVIMAEGYTGAGFEQYLTFQNPNTSALTLTITYLKADGTTVPKSVVVPGQQRKTVAVHGADPGIGPNQEISVRVTVPTNPGNIGVLAERVMYFRYKAVATGGSSAFGVLP